MIFLNPNLFAGIERICFLFLPMLGFEREI